MPQKNHKIHCAIRSQHLTYINLLMLLLICSTPLMAVTVEATVEPDLHTLLDWVWQNDASLQQIQAEQTGHEASALEADTLPNLMLGVDLSNVTADGLDFNQEPMSQFKLAVAQSLPRGDSRQLNSAWYNQQAQVSYWQQQQRLLELTEQVIVRVLKIQQTKHDLHINGQQKQAIEDLMQWLEAAYKSAYGGVQQQHLIQAELELLSNQDQQQAWQQKLDVQVAALRALLNTGQSLPADLENWLVSIPMNIAIADLGIRSDWQSLMSHPAVQAAGMRIEAAETQVSLAEQHKKPAFSFRGSYGYRDDATNGLQRDDLLSVGFSMDLPGFNERKTSQMIKSRLTGLRAAEANRESILQGHHEQQQIHLQRIKGLEQRIELYHRQLVPQLKQLAEVEMNAYTNEGADFSDVLRAQLRWYEARSQLRKLQTDQQISTIQLISLSSNGPQSLLDAALIQGDRHE